MTDILSSTKILNSIITSGFVTSLGSPVQKAEVFAKIRSVTRSSKFPANKPFLADINATVSDFLQTVLFLNLD